MLTCALFSSKTKSLDYSVSSIKYCPKTHANYQTRLMMMCIQLIFIIKKHLLFKKKIKKIDLIMLHVGLIYRYFILLSLYIYIYKSWVLDTPPILFGRELIKMKNKSCFLPLLLFVLFKKKNIISSWGFPNAIIS